MIGEEVLDYLHGENLGVKGTDLFLGFQPDEPANCVTIYEGTAPVLTEMSAHGIDAVGVQVLVRNTSYIEARSKVNTIHLKIAGFTGKFKANGYEVSQFIIVNSPISIGRDEKNRSEWSVQYAARILTTGNEHRTD